MKEVVDGKVQFRMIEGRMNSTEQRLIQQNLTKQQELFLSTELPMMKLPILQVGLACCFLVACTSTDHRLPAHGALLPSDAIKNSKSLDSSDVQVHGYLVAGFEDRGIWDSESDYRKYDSDLRCVSLLIPKNLLDQVERRSGTYTILKGRLVADLRSRGTAVLGSCSFVAIEVQEIST